MRRFTQLFTDLDQTNRTSEKVAAMERYFREAPPADAAWGLFFLCGYRLRGAVHTNAMRGAAMAAAGVPEWMLDECYEACGDLSEAVALLTPDTEASSRDEPLHLVMERRITPMIGADGKTAQSALLDAWAGLRREERLVFNKLVRGNFRVGVQKALVVRALSQAGGVDAPVLAHRLAGGFTPTASAYLALAREDHAGDAARPYPFCLAHQLERDTAELGDPRHWQAEYKWDGIRAQLVRRDGIERGVAIWSRGEEPITEQFPEVADAARRMPHGTVLDGEVLAWRFGTSGPGRPLSFNALQSRLNRKRVQASLFDEEGVVFAAFDILEHNGNDTRALPLEERRCLLESVLAPHTDPRGVLQLPPVVPCSTWSQAHAARAHARDEFGAEGLMLKHVGSRYHAGRVAGGTLHTTATDASAAGWWKWKVNPFSVDAVLMYAQQGSGRRAGLYTDYTFGVWDPGPTGTLVAFAKAYSGLSNEEIKRVDAFVRNNTVDRKGPVRLVRPQLVFEISFEAIQPSPRHKAGIAVRFPRMTRWRTDKSAAEADTMGAVRALLQQLQDNDARRLGENNR